MHEEPTEPIQEEPEEDPSNCDYMKNCGIPFGGDHSKCKAHYDKIMNVIFGGE